MMIAVAPGAPAQGNPTGTISVSPDVTSPSVNELSLGMAHHHNAISISG
jgi:hypothetical protein